MSTSTHQKFHAHIYFDETSITQASLICKEAGERFDIKVGRIHPNPVGPHPCGSCQLSFNQSLFSQLIPWLDNKRGNLTVLIHAVTGEELRDHTEHASWLGTPAPLDLSIFKN